MSFVHQISFVHHLTSLARERNTYELNKKYILNHSTSLVKGVMSCLQY